MKLFGERVKVFEKQNLLVGEFDPTVNGCYNNVLTFSFKVNPKKALYIELKTDNPVSIAIANDDGSSAYHKEDLKEITTGPILTNKNKEMGLLLGVFPGDKSNVSITIWMDKK